MTKREIGRKFDEIVGFAEVERFLETPVKHYSSGMYARLAFAVAAHLECEILAVDEVLAVGDLAFQQKCLAKMQDASHSGRTVLFVSHNLAAITRLCSRAMWLHHGQLVTDGPAPEVVARYLKTAIGGSAAVEWAELAQGPGNDGLKLGSVGVTDLSGEPISVVNVGQALQVRIGYYVGEAPMAFRCLAKLSTQGACAFATLEPREMLRERAGWYVSTVEIPGHLLAEGEYTVGVSVFASRGRKMHLCRVNDVVAFLVYDPVEGGSARGDYTEPLGGVMRPRLPWRMEYLGAARPALAPAVPAGHSEGQP